MSDDRLAEIGRRAARLCYAEGKGCDSICLGSCAAVVPMDKYLIEAADQVFTEYWDNHPANSSTEA